MERHFEYPARIEQDEAGFQLVTFPDFPEPATDRRSVSEALAEAVDCLEEAVAGRIKRGEDIPVPSPAQVGTLPVALSALYGMKAALYLSMREAQISQSDLGAKLGKDESKVRRLLDPKHATPISALERALRAIRKRAQVVVEDTE
jgi:antitoxin HicB